jgi:hypothetical protein
MRWLLLVLVVLVGHTIAQTGISELGGALGIAEGEIRTGVMPAVVGVLAAVVAIGIAAGVARVITRST